MRLGAVAASIVIMAVAACDGSSSGGDGGDAHRGSADASDGGRPDNLTTTIYKMDLSAVTSWEAGRPVTGTFLVRHNAFAVFPISLARTPRAVTEIGPSTVMEVQGGVGCADGTGPILNQLERGASSVARLDAAHILSLWLEMPYRVPQDDFTRVPGTFCIGYRQRERGWAWVAGPAVTPNLDPAEGVGRSRVPIDEFAIDAIAILFDSSTAIRLVELGVGVP